MTEEQRMLCRGLVIQPNRRAGLTKEEFLRRFPEAVEDGYVASSLLEKASVERSAEDLQCALIVGSAFGFTREQQATLSRLLEFDWHHSHEDIVEALGRFPTPESIDPLFRATQWVPTSLEYDDSRALAVKAIWALGRIPGPEAEARLETLAKAGEAIIREAAREQIERRNKNA